MSMLQTGIFSSVIHIFSGSSGFFGRSHKRSFSLSLQINSSFSGYSLPGLKPYFVHLSILLFTEFQRYYVFKRPKIKRMLLLSSIRNILSFNVYVEFFFQVGLNHISAGNAVYCIPVPLERDYFYLE